MAKITNKVTVQMYGDPGIQEQLVALFKEAGLEVSGGLGKDYTTKKGEEGHYVAYKLELKTEF